MLSAVMLTRDVDTFDAVFLHKDLIPELWGGFLDRRVQRNAKMTIFDFDDAIHLGRRGSKLARLFPGYSCITAGNEFLATFGRAHNPCVEIWPTVVDTEVFKPRQHREPGPVRIGWSGSHHTLKSCFPLITGIIAELAKSHDFEFILIADAAPELSWEGVNWRFIPWTPETEVAGLQQIDIGLMPLKDEPFERGKCGLKAITYMAVGAPALVSPVGVNEQIVLHGETGFHCRTDAEWLGYARRLIEDEALRLEMGRNARLRVEEQYAVHALLPRMIDLFGQVREFPL